MTAELTPREGAMLSFPNEEERSATVQRSLAKEFDLADRAYTFWLLQLKDEWLENSKLPRHVLELAMLLNLQACRHFRSIVEHCGRCEALNANIIARSLFETVLAQQFVLGKRIRITVEPILVNGLPAQTQAGKPRFAAKVGSRNTAQAARPSLPRTLRANLYWAHVCIDDQRAAEKLRKVPGLKRAAVVIENGIDYSLTSAFEAKIGPQWSYILRNRPHSYSGLSVADLAKSLHSRFTMWYESIYHVQSRMAHGTDALQQLEPSSDGRPTPSCLSSEAEVEGALRSGIAMFLANLCILQNNIGFGPEVERTANTFAAEFRTM
jgi:hypothetical protein